MIKLHEIPFSEFQKVRVDGDTSFFPAETTEDEVKELIDEFLALTNAKRHNQAGIAEGNWMYWSLKIQQLQPMIDLLGEVYISSVADLIRQEFDYPLTEETYKQDIQSIVSEAQQWDVKRLEYEETLKALQPKEGEKISYDYYTRVTNAISTMIGGHIPENINTRAWAHYYNQLIHNAEKAEKTNGKPGQH